MKSRALRTTDTELATAVVNGSIDAWHRFVNEYSRLIISVIRRYLTRESHDVHRTVFVQVLSDLRRSKLAEYDGSSALSTWVTLLSRRLCVDWLRSTRGRMRPPKWLLALPSREREAYRLVYIEGLDYAEVVSRMSLNGESISTVELSALLRRIDEQMSPALKRRLAFDLQAASIGVTSGRLLEYLQSLQADHQLEMAANNPLRDIESAELSGQMERLQLLIEKLPKLERTVVREYYYNRRSAREIAASHDLPGQRRVYTLIDRAVRFLRGHLISEGDSPKSFRPGRKHG